MAETLRGADDHACGRVDEMAEDVGEILVEARRCHQGDDPARGVEAGTTGSSRWRRARDGPGVGAQDVDRRPERPGGHRGGLVHDPVRGMRSAARTVSCRAWRGAERRPSRMITMAATGQRRHRAFVQPAAPASGSAGDGRVSPVRHRPAGSSGERSTKASAAAPPRVRAAPWNLPRSSGWNAQSGSVPQPDGSFPAAETGMGEVSRRRRRRCRLARRPRRTPVDLARSHRNALLCLHGRTTGSRGGISRRADAGTAYAPPWAGRT